MIVCLAICVCNNMITGITRYVRDVFMVCKHVTQSRALFIKLAYTLKQLRVSCSLSIFVTQVTKWNLGFSLFCNQCRESEKALKRAQDKAVTVPHNNQFIMIIRCRFLNGNREIKAERQQDIVDMA